MFKNEEGFSLLELVVAVGVAGIIAAVALPTFAGLQDKASQNSATYAASASAAEALANSTMGLTGSTGGNSSSASSNAGNSSSSSSATLPAYNSVFYGSGSGSAFLNLSIGADKFTPTQLSQLSQVAYIMVSDSQTGNWIAFSGSINTDGANYFPSAIYDIMDNYENYGYTGVYSGGVLNGFSYSISSVEIQGNALLVFVQ